LSRQLPGQDLRELRVPARSPPELLPRPGIHLLVDLQERPFLHHLAVPEPQRLSATPEPAARGLPVLRRADVVAPGRPLTLSTAEVVRGVITRPGGNDRHGRSPPFKINLAGQGQLDATVHGARGPG